MKIFNPSSVQVDYITQAIHKIAQTTLSFEQRNKGAVARNVLLYLRELVDTNVILDKGGVYVYEELFGMTVKAEIKLSRWHTVKTYLNY